MFDLQNLRRMSLTDHLLELHRMGQLSLWGDEDEQKHPRDSDGKFKAKGSGDTASKAGFKAPARHRAVDALRAKNGGLRPTEGDIKAEIERITKADLRELESLPEQQEPEPEIKIEVEKPKKNQRNHRYPDRNFTQGGSVTKWNANVEAIKIVKEIQSEQRQVTPEEQAALSKFTGWGQFPEMFDRRNEDFNDTKNQQRRSSLLTLIGEDAYKEARAATLNSHFTSPKIIDAHWEMARKLGFKGGRYLEPAVGSGYYLGLMPEDLSDRTAITAVELDTTTGTMAKELYPDANVKIAGFEKTPTPDNFYDLVATNVPFGNYKMFDDRYYPHMPLIHDYYFMRSVDTAKPGGLIMHVTSTGTLDKLSPKVREYLQENADFVSAVRMPEGTHADAAKTQVVTDMIVLRKKHPAIPETTDETPEDAQAKSGFTGVTRDSLGRLYHWRDGVRIPNPNINDVEYVPDPGGGDDIPVNQYFAKNPEQILGTLDRSGTMYSAGQKNVAMTDDFDSQLEAAIGRLPEGINWADVKHQGEAEKENIREIEAGTEYVPGSVVEIDGEWFQHDNGGLVPFKMAKSKEDRFRDMAEIMAAARESLDAQRSGEDATAARSRLNELYDEFVGENGALSLPANRALYKKLPDYPFLMSLEDFNASTKQADKTDVFRSDTVNILDESITTDNVLDASFLSLNSLGRIDLDSIAKTAGISTREAADRLVSEGVAYDDPSKGWVSRSEYLSGNVRRKLTEAQTAADADERYAANVAVLAANQPKDIEEDEIGVKLGAPWIPAKHYEEFAESVVGRSNWSRSTKIGYDKATAQFHMRNMEHQSQAVKEIWDVKSSGSRTVGFNGLLMAAMTGKPIVMRELVGDGEGGTTKKVSKEKTEEAMEKVAELKELFQDWIWEDKDRASELHRFYNDNFNNITDREFDGSHLTFPGMRKTWPDGTPLNLYQIQKDAVMRAVSTGRGLFGHEVGTGKTASMVASAMEMRRLGLAKKPAICCLKSNIGQIAAEAQELYPDAKILSVEGLFDKANRETMLNRIATGDYDMIVMSHDNFERMPMKPEAQAKFIQAEIAEMDYALTRTDSITDASIRRNSVKAIELKKKKLDAQLQKALSGGNKDNVYFEDTGIDQLFVDEAHSFKNLGVKTANQQVKGVPGVDGSNKAMDMFFKTQYLTKKHDGRGVVFATGTPISNSMVELYNMQKYLQYDDLKERGVDNFDAWKDTYGDTTNRFEFKLDGEITATTRFAEFVNLPELRSLASEVIDIKRASDIPGIKRPPKNDQVISSLSTPRVEAFMEDIHQRAKSLAGKGRAGKGEDNMLSVCSDARLGSIDERLVNKGAPDDPGSKANRIVKQVLQLYQKHDGETQALFSDVGINPTKATGFSLFDDIKEKLIAGGIPESQIINFSDPAMKGDKRKEAQARLKRGEARIALGSTQSLGTGTNIQKNLRAIHHIDIPWRPSDLEQREGRGYRAGNKIKGDLGIYKYVQEGSADNLFWQIVGTKAHFINQFMLGKGNRTMAELDGEEVSASEMIAIATGDPDLVERLNLKDTVRRMTRSKRRHASNKVRYKDRIKEGPKVEYALQERLKAAQITKKFVAADDAPFIRMDGDYSNEESYSRKQRKEASEAAEGRMMQAFSDLSGGVSRMKGSGGTEAKKFIFEYRGLRVYATGNGNLKIASHAQNREEYYEAGPTLRSLDNAIKRMAKKPLLLEQEIEAHQDSMKQLTTEMGKPFRKLEKLAEAEARLTFLKDKAEMKGKS